MYKGNIQKIYLYNFFHSFIFAYVIERLFWASKGISVMQVVWIEVIYAAVIMMLELPMGMLADRFSRKALVISDAVLALVEFLIITLATTFGHFVIAIVLSAIGHTLQSGAHNALVYDSLKKDGKEATFEKVLGRIKGIDYFATMASGLIGGLIAARYTYATTYWVSMISLLIALIISLTLKEVIDEDKKDDPWAHEDWKKIGQFVLHHKSVRRMMTIVLVTAATINYVFEFWQLYVEAIGFKVIYFGMIQLIGFGGIALSSAYAYKIKEWFGLNKTMFVALIVAVISFLVMGTIQSQWALACLFIAYMATALIEPLGYGHLHEQALPEYRATIESAFSMLEKIVVVIVGLPFGYLATKGNIFIGFGYLGILLLILSLYFLFIEKDKVM